MSREPIRDRLRLISHFAGRLRIRADTFRVLPEVGTAVAGEVRELDGVVESSCSVVTGSILVRYEPDKIQLPRLVTVIVRAGGLHGLALVTDDWEKKPTPGKEIRRVLGDVDQRVRAATAGRMDLRAAIPAGLTAAGLGLFLAGSRRVPEWYDLVFWGFVTFVNVNPPAPDDGTRR